MVAPFAKKLKTSSTSTDYSIIVTGDIFQFDFFYFYCIILIRLTYLHKI